jgi:DNA-binding NarL/FixJ family response regulator
LTLRGPRLLELHFLELITWYRLKLLRGWLDNRGVDDYEDGQNGAAVGTSVRLRPRDAGQPPAQPALENASGHPRVVVIDCPSPLVADRLARALERTHLDYQQGPPQAGVPCIVVLWVENAKDVPGRVKHTREVSPDASILVVGPSADLPLARVAFRSGARGFIHAGMQQEQIVHAVEVAARGEPVVPRELLEHLVAGEGSADLGMLTSRQREILELVAEGLSNSQIAKRLYLSESTIKQHLGLAYKLLGVKNRIQATRLFRQSNEDRSEANARRQESKQRVYEEFAALALLPPGFHETSEETSEHFEKLARTLGGMDLYASVPVRARARAAYDLELQRDAHEEGSEEYQNLTERLDTVRSEFIEEARKELGFPPGRWG